MRNDPMSAPMSREEFTVVLSRVTFPLLPASMGDQDLLLANDAALRAALAAAEARIAQLEDGLRAVWESYDGRDPLEQRHAAALNAIPALLAPRPETEAEYSDAR